MKKLISLLLAVAMLLSFAACGEKTPDPVETTVAEETTTVPASTKKNKKNNKTETTTPTTTSAPKTETESMIYKCSVICVKINDGWCVYNGLQVLS